MPKTDKKPQPETPSTGLLRLRYVERIRKAKGAEYLYYKRGGVRIPLPSPEGSLAFRLAYKAAQERAEKRDVKVSGAGTVFDAVTLYLASADYAQLSTASQRDYRRTLDISRGAFGHLQVTAIDEPWLEELRGKYIGRAIEWNGLRSRMIMVVDNWRRLHPHAIALNPWRAVRRLKVAQSNQNHPWKAEILRAVMRAATPEFRALLIGYLMTAQRGGDVTRFTPAQYDAEAQTLSIRQGKTGEPILIHVPASLAAALAAMKGRNPERLFVTPRGKAWKLTNAQETLQTLLRGLDLPRHTLHGLRAIGPVALKLLGFENRSIRALTGHTSDANLEIYLRGVDHYPLAMKAQEALDAQFAEVFAEAEGGANQRRFSGLTGRAASKAKKASVAEEVPGPTDVWTADPEP